MQRVHDSRSSTRPTADLVADLDGNSRLVLKQKGVAQEPRRKGRLPNLDNHTSTIETTSNTNKKNISRRAFNGLPRSEGAGCQPEDLRARRPSPAFPSQAPLPPKPRATRQRKSRHLQTRQRSQRPLKEPISKAFEEGFSCVV